MGKSSWQNGYQGKLSNAYLNEGVKDLIPPTSNVMKASGLLS